MELLNKQKKMEEIEKKDTKLCYTVIKKLNPKDIFGLVEIICENEQNQKFNKTLLVSDGSEVILINKTFFIKHISLDFKNYLREKVGVYF